MAHIKKIDLYTTGENGGFVKTFRSLNECAKYLGISNLTISNALTGRFVSKSLNGYRVEYSDEIKRAADSKPKGKPVFIEKIQSDNTPQMRVINEIVQRYRGKAISKSAFIEHLRGANIIELGHLKLRIESKKVCDVYVEMLEFFRKK